MHFLITYSSHTGFWIVYKNSIVKNKDLFSKIDLEKFWKYSRLPFLLKRVLNNFWNIVIDEKIEKKFKRWLVRKNYQAIT